MRYLLDTGAAVAFACPDDALHVAARAVFRESRLRLVTSSVVLGEMYTFLRGRRGYRVAMDWVNVVKRSSMIEVAQIGEREDQVVWDIVRSLAGVPLSYADATLIHVGRARGIDTVFTFDTDFLGAGLKVVPGL